MPTIIVSLIIIGICLLVNAIIAGEFADSAERKGYARRRYWHMCFWLGIVGALSVVALPDRKALEQRKAIADKLDQINENLRTSGAAAVTNGSAAAVNMIDLPEL